MTNQRNAMLDREINDLKINITDKFETTIGITAEKLRENLQERVDVYAMFSNQVLDNYGYQMPPNLLNYYIDDSDAEINFLKGALEFGINLKLDHWPPYVPPSNLIDKDKSQINVRVSEQIRNNEDEISENMWII